MANRWEDVEDLLFDGARADVEDCCGEVHPCLVAFAGPHLRFIADVRPFPKGQYHHPLIELLALAMPLDADRLALSLSGRASSLDDPIAPVLPGGPDLRQRVVILHFVDGARGRPRVHTVFHPFDRDDDGATTWQAALRLDDEPLGWIPEVLRVSAQQRGKLRASDARIREQAERCVTLGHDLFLPPDLGARLRPAANRPPRRRCRTWR